MTGQLTLRVRNAVEALRQAMTDVESWLAALHVHEDQAYVATLGIEELVSNCIKYAYDDAARHDIDVRLTLEGTALTLVVEDDGHAFDPLQAPPPDLTLPIEQRPIGGLGLHLLRTLSNEMHYERRDGRNRVTLVTRAP